MYTLQLIITKQHNNNIVIVIVFSLLIILVAPVVTTNNSLLESFDIDGTLTLMCSFEGVPLPSLEWTHNGIPLSSSTDSVTITNNQWFVLWHFHIAVGECISGRLLACSLVSPQTTLALQIDPSMSRFGVSLSLS